MKIVLFSQILGLLSFFVARPQEEVEESTTSRNYRNEKGVGWVARTDFRGELLLVRRRQLFRQFFGNLVFFLKLQIFKWHLSKSLHPGHPSIRLYSIETHRQHIEI